MRHTEKTKFTDLVHCPSCTHNVPASIEVVNKRIRVTPGQKCPRCQSALDAAVVLPQLEAA
jgi:DNA-directed RNA polymerase subunit RPC12/RpoP